MIDRIIDFSARNKLLIFLLVGVAVAAGWWSLQNVPLDAIPDLSDTQVIIYSRWDRSPDIMEDQVTYPIITALLGAPHVKDIRGFSDFGYSYVYIIFDEGADTFFKAIEPRREVWTPDLLLLHVFLPRQILRCSVFPDNSKQRVSGDTRQRKHQSSAASKYPSGSFFIFSSDLFLSTVECPPDRST